MAVVRKTFKVKFFGLSEIEVKGGRLVAVPKVQNGVELNRKQVSENRLFRAFDPENFLVLKFDYKQMDDQARTKLLLALTHGIECEGKVYRRLMRSASQMRTGKAVFTCLPVEEVIERVTYGAKFGDMVNMSKREARIGLALSSTIEVDVPFSYRVIPDFKRTITVLASVYNEKKKCMEEVVKEITITPTDGQGYIRYPLAKKIAKALGLSYVPSAFQVRYAGAKGLLIVWKWPRDMYEEDILFTESMWKYDFDPNYPVKPKLEIAAWTKPAKSEYVRMTYQFLQALNIDAKTLIGLADESLARVQETILTVPEHAMKFLGMVDFGEEEEYVNTLATRLQCTLAADPEMIRDPYVQAKLRAMLKKFVLDMRKGRVPVKGGYHYIVCDPSVHFGREEGILGPEEYYLNGQEGTVAAFRSPLIHPSEVVRANLVNKEDLVMTEPDGFVYLKDLFVVNSYDDTLPRMGGADVDGDRALVTGDERIVNAVAGGLLIYDEGREGKKVPNTREELVKFDLQTFTPSRIGLITNWATAWLDIARHNGQEVSERVAVLRVLQGQEIDAAKTGYVPEIPERLQATWYPHWLRDRKDVQGKEYNPRTKQGVYRSRSPMGQLYDYILKFWEAFKQNLPDTKENNMIKVVSRVPNLEEYTQVLDYVKELERQYRFENQLLAEWEKRGTLQPDEIAKQRAMLFERYTEVLASLDADPRSVAAAAYYAAYTNGGHSRSFPWLCAFEGLLMLLEEGASQFRLVPVRKAPEGAEIVEIDGRQYAKVPVKQKVSQEVVKPEIKKVMVTLKGFRYQGLTAYEAAQAIKNARRLIVVQEGKYLYVVADGKKVGVIGAEDALTGVMLKNKELRFVHHGALAYTEKRTGKVRDASAVPMTFEVIGDLESTVSDEVQNHLKVFGLALEAAKVVGANRVELVLNYQDKQYKIQAELVESIVNFSAKIKTPEVRQALAEEVKRLLA